MSLDDITPKAILQILILAMGIYLLLAFLRSARGSGLVRGLGLTLIIGVYGLWWISGYFELGELRHVIQAFLSLVFVILAIVFQPELRRGISSLSDNPLLSRLLRTQRKESIVEVALAVVSMAKKKQGALIAFERRTPLDSYASQAVPLDCEVNRYLIDTLFHPGSALHDGGVIVRGDRVVAAGAVFPLSETDDVAKSTGTRHRAALGITEETDAVAIAVSEETGLISITKHGKMERRIKRDQVEEVLRDALGTDGLVRRSLEEGEEAEQPAPADIVPNVFRTLVAHGGQKLGALLIAVFVFYGAHQDLMGRKGQPLRVVQTANANAPAEPGKLTVVLPSRLYRLKEEPTVDVTFVGTHEDLAVSTQEVSGRIVLTEEELGDGGEDITIEADRVTWSLAMGDRIEAYWSGADLQLAVEELAALEVNLRSELVAMDHTQLGRRYAVDLANMEFRPSVVKLRGPSAAIKELEEKLAASGDGPAPIFELDQALTSELVSAGPGSFWVGCKLIAPAPDADLEVKPELEMEEKVEVKVTLALSSTELGELTLPISLVALSGVGDTGQFLPPSAQATVRVFGRGVPDREQGSDEWRLDGLEILSLVRDHVRAFIDVDRMDPGSNQGLVELHEPADWPALLKELGSEFEYVTNDPRITLIVELIGDREVFVDTREMGPGEDNDEEDQVSENEIFGTDGIRGRAGEGWLTPTAVAAVGRAAGSVLGSDGAVALLGHDGRASSPEIEAALAAGLAEVGVRAVSLGRITTPGLAWLTRRGHYAIGAMISASHNPAEDNGIKLFSSAGGKLADDEQAEIEQRLRANSLPDVPDPMPPPHDRDLLEDYLDHLSGHACPDLSLDGLEVVVDCANGGGSDVAPPVLERLGARVTAIAASPDGVNINRNCGSTHPERLQERVRERGAAVGIALDGDGDRCILVDEHGALVHGDGIMTVVARHAMAAGEYADPRVVATVMSNRGLHRALREVGLSVHEVAVGDRAVVEGMRSEGLLLGGEQSGHVIFGEDEAYIGDGTLTALRVLRVLRETGRSLSELAAPYQEYPQVLLNLPVASKPPLESLPSVARAVAEVEGELGDEGRVLLRYSGTENLARVMVEGPDEGRIRAQAERIAERIRAEIEA